MKMMRSAGISLVIILFSAPLVRGQDLSKYRNFSLGMSLPELSSKVDLRPLHTKLIQKHPAVVQEMAYWPGGSSDHSRQADSVWQIFFSFYNGELFRILVTYDQDAMHGLTAEDMVQAISTEYGTATWPAGEISFPTNELYRTTEKVVARWEDSQYSINLVRSRFLNSFALAMFSKRLNAQAEAAIAKSLKMEGQEDPQKEIDRQKKRPMTSKRRDGRTGRCSTRVLVQSHTHECPRCGTNWKCGEANHRDECPYPTRSFCAKCWAQEVPRDTRLPEEKE